MGEEIIAEKYALIRTRGCNGVAFTHLVEDMVLGERFVVKVSDKLGPLGLEYLKAANLLKEMAVRGVLMPLEGGIMEEEAGCYLCFPQVGEPSLENYLDMGMPLSCRETVRILREAAAVLRDMHRAGFYHLFLNARNVFYRPRGRILIKDPALKPEFFSPLLEAAACPDFRYFSPRVMDGGELEAGADVYALGKLAERLLEGVEDYPASPAAPAVERIAEACRCRSLTAAGLVAYIDEVTAACPAADPGGSERLVGGGGKSGGGAEPAALAGVTTPGRGMVARLASVAIILVALCAVAAGLFAVSSLLRRKEPAARAGAVGVSAAGLGNVAAARLERGAKAVDGSPETVEPEGEDGAETESPAPEEPDAWGPEALAEEAGEEEGDGDRPPAAEPEAGEAELSPRAPVASFTLSPVEGRSPLRVYLDASSSHDPDGAIVSYSWSFGASGPCVYHVFESNVIPANLAVTLTVTDDGGNSSSATRYVTVY
ncbi:MAG: PKD domain-containing protein [Actinomycetota bacterium]|nr:PKD domain-containing protein [Actinomycetota bacterium]